MEPFGREKLEVRHVEGSQDHLSGSQGASCVLPLGFSVDPEDNSVSNMRIFFRDSHMRLPLTLLALLRTPR